MSKGIDTTERMKMIEDTREVPKIDFDEASREWLKNKKRHLDGYFTYKCKEYDSEKDVYCSNRLFREGYCREHWRGGEDEYSLKVFIRFLE